MPITWLNCILSRRYALTVTGDPIPSRPAAVDLTHDRSADGDGWGAEADTHDGACAEREACTEGEACAANRAGTGADPKTESTPDATAPPSTATPSIAPDTRPNDGPFLILANNPSLIDPLLLYSHVAKLNPLVIVRHEQSPALRMFARTADMALLPPAQDATDHEEATNSPKPDHPSHEDPERRALTQAADALAQGRSVLMWPSPHAQRTGYECVPAHNCAFSLLQLLAAREQKLPELFLVRTEGLWGSRFSWYNGQAPSFGSTLWTHVPAVLLGPFLKRRPVRMVMRRHKLHLQNLQQRAFQAMLNAWFGAGHEGAQLVPCLSLRRSRCMPLEVLTQAEACAAVQAAATGTPPPADSTGPATQPSAAQSQTALAEKAQAPLATATGAGMPPAASLPHPAADSSGAGSSSPRSSGPSSSGPNHGQLAHGPEHGYDYSQPHEGASDSPNADYSQQPDTLNSAENIKAAPNTPLADISPAVPRTPPLLPVQHALTRQGSVTDASYGHHFSRRTLLGLAKAIGTLIGPVPATRIGMSLPCGTGAMATYIGILDCTLEDDRIPVLLDPNMSPEQLAYCAQETGITHVVTSRTFNGRGLPPNTQPIYLEDITSAQAMRGSALSFMGFAGTTEVDSLAAIICSASGQSTQTPALEQPVPLFLQHQELMTALHSLITHLSAPPLNVHSLSILGCLPPHTPLGLLVNVVLPLTCGVPIVTVDAAHDAVIMARSAENHSVNFFTGSPSSMKSLLHEARSHLPFRYVMLSQEPCPPDLLALIPKACPHARIFSADMHGTIVLLS